MLIQLQGSTVVVQAPLNILRQYVASREAENPILEWVSYQVMDEVGFEGWARVSLSARLSKMGEFMDFMEELMFNFR